MRGNNMLREIKFRAIIDGKVLSSDRTEQEIGIRGLSQYDEGESDRYILSQFTGLLDRNSREIYEGDILKHNSPAIGSFVVVWHCLESGMVGFPIMGNFREVIGNIYENPDMVSGAMRRRHG